VGGMSVDKTARSKAATRNTTLKGVRCTVERDRDAVGGSREGVEKTVLLVLPCLRKKEEFRTKKKKVTVHSTSAELGVEEKKEKMGQDVCQNGAIESGPVEQI